MKNPSVNDAAPNADPDAPLARLLGPWLENLHENQTDHIRHTRHTVSHVANPLVTAPQADLAEALGIRKTVRSLDGEIAVDVSLLD